MNARTVYPPHTDVDRQPALPLAGEIAGENQALKAVCNLLERETPFDEWPPILSGALAEAIRPMDGSHRETAKAARLERHLFGAVEAPEMTRSGDDIARVADRLRADLADLVPFGSGFHLISYEKAAGEWMIPAT